MPAWATQTRSDFCKVPTFQDLKTKNETVYRTACGCQDLQLNCSKQNAMQLQLNKLYMGFSIHKDTHNRPDMTSMCYAAQPPSRHRGPPVRKHLHSLLSLSHCARTRPGLQKHFNCSTWPRKKQEELKASESILAELWCALWHR